MPAVWFSESQAYGKRGAIARSFVRTHTDGQQRQRKLRLITLLRSPLVCMAHAAAPACANMLFSVLPGAEGSLEAGQAAERCRARNQANAGYGAMVRSCCSFDRTRFSAKYSNTLSSAFACARRHRMQSESVIPSWILITMKM